MASRTEPDEHAATELVLFIENTNGLSLDSTQGQGRSVRDNLLKRWEKGTYDFEKSIKLMGYLVESGAKQYVKEMGGGSWHRMFNAATREVAAHALAEQFRTAAQGGEYTRNARRFHQNASEEYDIEDPQAFFLVPLAIKKARHYGDDQGVQVRDLDAGVAEARRIGESEGLDVQTEELEPGMVYITAQKPGAEEYEYEWTITVVKDPNAWEPTDD